MDYLEQFWPLNCYIFRKRKPLYT